MRILIADDNHDIANSLGSLLGTLLEPPAELDIAYDGEEALAFALNGPHEVAVLDINMPKMSGTEAADSMRSLLGDHRPILISMSGSASVESDPNTLLPFDHAFGKPVDVDRLLALLRSL